MGSATKVRGFESYVAKADEDRAMALASVQSPFSIEVQFAGGLTSKQRDAFKTAADRWTKIIVGDIPSVMADGVLIDDLVIVAQGADIDGVNGILGQAGPTRLRPKTGKPSDFLPARGKMVFDTADLANMEQNGTLVDVITHEMGHVLGVGTIWTFKKLLKGPGTSNPRFTGTNARKEYGTLRKTGPTDVPVENTHGPGTRDSHWRESVFESELMTGFVEGSGGNPLSRLTIASLQDLGYVVDLKAAEKYHLPNLLHLAEGGFLVAAAGPLQTGFMSQTIPVVLPPDSVE
jgi:hypothetical protein